MTRARKPRQPTTHEDALARAYELLGIDEAERVTSRSRSLLWAMSDPAKPEEATIKDGLRLDEALIDAGEPTVIADTIRASNDLYRTRQHAEPRPGHVSLERVTLHLGSAIGELQAAVLEATDPDGRGGAAVTPCEWSEIGRLIAEGERVLQKLRGLAPRGERLVPRSVGAGEVA